MSERKGTEVGEGGGNGGKGREGGVVGGWGRGERQRELKQPFALTFSSLHTYTHTHTHTHTQISAGVRHAVASNSTLSERGVTSIAVPSSVPAQYSALKDIPCHAIHARLLLLNYFSKLMISSWRLFNSQSTQVHGRKGLASLPDHSHLQSLEQAYALISVLAGASTMSASDTL